MEIYQPFSVEYVHNDLPHQKHMTRDAFLLPSRISEGRIALSALFFPHHSIHPIY